jgi:uncharacterized protein (TIGR02611 family)
MTAVDRWRAFRQRVIATRSGRLTLRIIIATVGAIIVVSGLILVPLPGPGWLIVLAGLAVWALEFAWAQHVLVFTRRQLKGWWDWVNQRHWSVRVLVGLSGLLFVAAVTWASLAVSVKLDTPAQLWDRLVEP